MNTPPTDAPGGKPEGPLPTPHDPLADPVIAARHLADAVVAAGAVAVEMFRTGVKSWSKHNDSPVTEADLAVDVMLRERLSLVGPGYGWLSEETVDEPSRLSRRRVWIVDPIDGTRSYMSGGMDWCVEAALVEDGRPIAGALFAPVTEELFVAVRGGGATRNGQPIRVSGRPGVIGAKVDGPTQWLGHIAGHDTFERVTRIRSLALRIARVATGELDAAFASPNGNDWDLAAADLLVHEAGGRLTTLDGHALAYNAPVPRHGALVSAGLRLHPSLTDVAR
ncbi:3'(2'),5'-bisphosphate nucleotidase CysQ [Ancylobacter pratisalsi]|uniref:3'(2'),5'-bisphosphate nucleotidase CysQ n=1 Tax=Ancylobacter pratisalsi TaxID=1745854 RepID=A0A6P1YX72_9HYPH|nr:3'(2'),5'-bisphosphate nucleotidase CysQ [Ancylobacter pratisalsi]QIB36174.1 3'(2'),5'-bisphosphate nucleotidase CysQ [Ancylobacter pratisalsi]